MIYQILFSKFSIVPQVSEKSHLTRHNQGFRKKSINLKKVHASKILSQGGQNFQRIETFLLIIYCFQHMDIKVRNYFKPNYELIYSMEKTHTRSQLNLSQQQFLYSSIQTSANRMEFFLTTLTPVLHLQGLLFLKICPTWEQGMISNVPPHIQT